MSSTNITHRELSHPGANDPTYRKRRDEIAQRANEERDTLPRIIYTRDEEETWNHVRRQLKPLHRRFAAASVRQAHTLLELPMDYIPQLADVSTMLHRGSNFRLRLAGGLIESQSFLTALGEKTMFCTQYVRHHSRPDYTPEPDVIHELIGHVPLFLDREFAAFTVLIGQAAKHANDEQLQLLEHLYWFTIEFGLISEQGQKRAFGAGLLSSSTELPHALSREVEHLPFEAQVAAETAYDFTAPQPRLFVVSSFHQMIFETKAFLGRLGLPTRRD